MSKLKILKIVTAKNGNIYAQTEKRFSVLATPNMKVGDLIEVETYEEKKEEAAEKSEAERKAREAAEKEKIRKEIEAFLSANSGNKIYFDLKVIQAYGFQIKGKIDSIDIESIITTCIWWLTNEYNFERNTIKLVIHSLDDQDYYYDFEKEEIIEKVFGKSILSDVNYKE